MSGCFSSVKQSALLDPPGEYLVIIRQEKHIISDHSFCHLEMIHKLTSGGKFSVLHRGVTDIADKTNSTSLQLAIGILLLLLGKVTTKNINVVIKNFLEES